MVVALIFSPIALTFIASHHDVIGFSSASASDFALTTRRLVVTVAPGLISASTTETGTVSVQLKDNATGNPAPAPSNVQVVLTSSNTSVVDIVYPNSNPVITIPAGSWYTSVPIHGGGLAGKANITASAQGYLKGSSSVVAEHVTETPNQLGIYFATDTLMPNNVDYSNAVVVALQYRASNGTIFPAINTGSNVTVYARSSNNATMFVDTAPRNITPNTTNVAFDIASTLASGRASITALLSLSE